MDRQVKIKVWHLLAIAVVFILGAGIGGNQIGNKTLKDEIKIKRSKVDSLQSDNLLLKDKINAYNTRLGELEAQENNYYNEYIYERSKRLQLQRQNKALLDSIFSRYFLDSIADHYRFKRNNLR